MKKKLKLLLLALSCSLVFTSNSFAQDNNNGEAIPQVYPGAIPSSPAFSLLGVNPEIVTRPSDIKEFKVDWRIKNYKVAPDLALEFQPLWWFYYRRKGMESYQNASKLEKVLSTLSLSMATAKMDGLNHMGMAFKVNLYKEFDPYMDADLQAEYELMGGDYLNPLELELDSLLFEFRYSKDQEVKEELRKAIDDKEMELALVRRELMDEFQLMGTEYAKKKWNTDMLDMAFGLVNKYNNGAIDSLKMRYAGFGLWLNGAKGIGKNGLVTGMVRLNRIGQNNDFLIGASYRYGSDKFNVFVELVYQRYANNVSNGFHEDEIFGANRDYDIGTAWYEFAEGEKYSTYTLSYGGDFKLRKNILLNFALRTQIKRGVGFDSFLPVANVVCLMN